MSLFSYVRSIYALDTIDTRFTSSSTTPYKTVVDARSDSASSTSKRDDSVLGAGVKTDRRGRPVAKPSLWNTPEFYFYYFVFITIVPYMFWIAYDVSRREYVRELPWAKADLSIASDPNYKKYEPWLSPGWVPGRKIVNDYPRIFELQTLTAGRIYPMPSTRAFEETYPTLRSS